MTGQSGQVVDHLIYDAWGNVTSESNLAAGDRYEGFGYQRDATGNYYDLAREYASMQHVFMQQDPLGLAAGSNSYSYVDSNPTNANDPYGLKAVLVYKRIRETGRIADLNNVYKELLDMILAQDRAVLKAVNIVLNPVSLGIVKGFSATHSSLYKAYTFEWDVKCADDKDIDKLKLVADETSSTNGVAGKPLHTERAPGKGFFRVIQIGVPFVGTHRLIFMDMPGATFAANENKVIAFTTTVKIEGLEKSELKVKIAFTSKKGDIPSVKGPERLDK